ncbi:MAG: hypothetical protein M1827_003948 [Pycnora praestabilis]|nr:MAG: hypothetical protein M1827_003948 [Pycnora praestabilis]
MSVDSNPSLNKATQPFFLLWTAYTPYSPAGASDPSPRSPLASPVSPLTTHPGRRKERSSESKRNSGEPAVLPRILVKKPIEESASSGRSSRASSNSDKAHSRASSITSVKSILKGLRVAGTATKDGQPPREPRSGFVWSREESGHWLEIGIIRKRRVQKTSKSADESVVTAQPASTAISRRTSISTKAVERRQVLSETNATDKSSRKGEQSLLAIPSDSRKGLYHRSKRFFRAMRRDSVSLTDVDSPDAKSSASETAILLDMVANALRSEISTEHRRHTGASNSPTSTNGSTKRSYKLRSFSQARGRTLSTSSSILSLMVGRPPSNTPRPEAMYGGRDSTDYLKVEISDFDNPSFLPSEARRINTPPLASESHRRGRLRGFFFDLSSPGGAPLEEGQDRNIVPSPGETSPIIKMLQRRDTISISDEAQWFRIRGRDIEQHNTVEKNFELNVPEHLPSSPLCPMNPKHQSGGKGICVFHGRNRTLSKDE